MIPGASQRLRSAVAFLAIAAHNAEEGLFARKWVLAHSDLLARYIRPGVLDMWAGSGMKIGLVTLTLVVFAMAITAARAARGSFAVHLILGVLALFAANALVPHIVGAIALRGYVPGVATAVALILPVTVWVFTSSVRDGFASRAGARSAAAIGVALYAAVALIALSVK